MADTPDRTGARAPKIADAIRLLIRAVENPADTPTVRAVIEARWPAQEKACRQEARRESTAPNVICWAGQVIRDLLGDEQAIRASNFNRQERIALVDLYRFCRSKLFFAGIQERDETLEYLENTLAKIALPGKGGGGAGSGERGRGRPRRTEQRKAQQAERAAEWTRFFESKCWKGKPGTPKAQFCEQEGIDRDDLETALRRGRDGRSKPKSAKERKKVGGK